MRNDLEAALAGTIDEGRFLYGRSVALFEREFAAYCSVAEAIAVGSGTAAITIALRALGIAAGDEVITAANTCPPTVAGIAAAGAAPVLADVEENTLTLDPAAVEAAITARTRAVVPVHLYGQCADMDAIGAIARRHGLAVVEDAAQGHGAEFRGRRAGSLGDAAAFSFYPTKNLGTLGDGGAVTTNRPDVAEAARVLRQGGIDGDHGAVVGATHSRLSSFDAAVLSAKLARLSSWNERRRELAGVYREALRSANLCLPAESPGRTHVYHLFVIRAEERDNLRARLREVGIQTLVHYDRAIHEHPAYEELAPARRSLARSERAAREVLSLPLYPELEAEELEAVASAVLGVLSS